MIKKLRVLVSEDDRITQEFYNSFLSEEIFERYFAKSGEEALDVYRTWKPEVIILDLMLPVVSGYSVLKEIREELGDKETPILISSKLSMKDDILACAELGVQGYLAKPVNWKELGFRVLECYQISKPQMADRVTELRKQIEAKRGIKERPEPGGGAGKQVGVGAES
ncbi:MAG TPA: response regulator, partial [Thermodesulfobacteriota bacterium]|nr:response regulator [Thermodesulfobacteriota bacterium]